ncbi:MAG: DUF3574 domain-containing protein [Bacteroidota bacterium]
MIKRSTFVLPLLIALAACAPELHTSALQSVIVERLFFGRNVHGVPAVSDSAWGAFLAEEVTPRFPDGFTVWPAAGQWRGADGRIERETSFVLELVHPSSATADSNVAVIIAAYKQRFQQEAVLRVIIPAHTSF